LEISTGRVYISRDVVFDENVFPFALLHPNAGAQLRKELLLLLDLLNPFVGGTNNDDYMPNTCSPIPAMGSMQETEANMEENGADLSPNGAGHRMQTTTGQTTTDPEDDSLHLSATGSRADPPDSGAESASSASHTASVPSSSRHSRSSTLPAHDASMFPPARAATRPDEVGSSSGSARVTTQIFGK
jgi:hypothetical protein